LSYFKAFEGIERGNSYQKVVCEIKIKTSYPGAPASFLPNWLVLTTPVCVYVFFASTREITSTTPMPALPV